MEIKKRKFLLLVGDIFFAYLALFTCLFIRHFTKFNFQILKEHLFPFTLIYFFWIIIFYALGLYDFNRNLLFFKIIPSLFLNFIIGVSFFYFSPFFGITPKTILLGTVLIFSLFSFFWRNLFFIFFSRFFQNRILILAGGKEAEDLKREINEKPFLGYKLIDIKINENFLPQIKKEGVNIVIFGDEYLKNSQFLEILNNLIFEGVRFLEFSQGYEMITEKIPISKISKIWFLENLREGEKRIYDKTKKIFDFLLSFFILLITLPLWCLISIAIKLEDGGPIFYLQRRVGKNKKFFNLIKFRSMVPEAEKEGPKWAEVEDKRVTKVGKILRQFHLDELPQMINVLKGDISLVGPRPERPEFVEKLEKEIPYYNLRHIIKPGFTGWAQIKFRYARSIEDSLEKFQYDLYYIKNRSLLFDIRILLKTLQLFFKKE